MKKIHKKYLLFGLVNDIYTIMSNHFFEKNIYPIHKDKQLDSALITLEMVKGLLLGLEGKGGKH